MHIVSSKYNPPKIIAIDKASDETAIKEAKIEEQKAE